MDRENLLLVANSEQDANMLHAVGLFVPEPFIYLRARGKAIVVMNDVELGRARKKLRHCEVLALSDYRRKLKGKGVQSPGFAHVVRQLVRELQLEEVTVPANFPFGLASELRRLKVPVRIKNGAVFPEREFKSPREVKKISAALTMAEVGLSEAIQVLKCAKAGKNKKLFYRDAPLTAEKLRSVIEIAIIQAGGLACRTVVAGGKQGSDPHERGQGILRANEPILLDVFPRSQKTGYFGDITRTVVKGRASEAVRRVYHAVVRAQEVAFQGIRNNQSGAEVHRTVQDFFKEAEYPTDKKEGWMEGFIHGTGHGLGIENREPPRIGPGSTDILRTGQVVVVGPGLYYPELGGVRVEDVVLVSDKPPRNLTQFEKVLEL
jgi:Xaa-Pro aminopeptidase